LVPVALGILCGCSTLPSSGPTGSQIRSSAEEAIETGTGPQITLLEVDRAEVVPPALAPVEWTLPTQGPVPTDMIGPGDVLTIAIYEAGIPLFGTTSAGMEIGASFDPAVKMQTLPASRVNDDGEITIPYVGRLNVQGMTVGDVQDLIGRSLRSMSQDPQVLVNRQQVITNSVIVAGEVVQPGRLVLQTNEESMSDVIALSGGYRGDPKDLVLRVKRGENEARIRLSKVMAGAYEDLKAYPGDRLTVLPEPLMYSVMGASGRVQQFGFTRDTMTVMEAIANAGGPNRSTADPQAVFLLRFTGPNGSQPVVYHFNLMKTPTYFLAQQFALRDDDILYFGNAEANQPRELIQTISQLFAPVVTVTTVANSFGN
jgi:polysaccharide export outer membrane protein